MKLDCKIGEIKKIEMKPEVIDLKINDIYDIVHLHLDNGQIHSYNIKEVGTTQDISKYQIPNKFKSKVLKEENRGNGKFYHYTLGGIYCKKLNSLTELLQRSY